MTYLFHLNSAKQYYIYKDTINKLIGSFQQVHIIVSNNKELENVLYNNKHHYKVLGKPRHTVVSPFRFLVSAYKAIKCALYIIKNEPDVVVSNSISSLLVSRILNIPSITYSNVRDGDKGRAIRYGLSHSVLVPETLKNTLQPAKAVYFRTFGELAYLHPQYAEVPGELDDLESTINSPDYLFVLREDKPIDEIKRSVIEKLIDKFSKMGSVGIIYDGLLKEKHEKYRITPFKESDIRNLTYNASALISNNASFCIEAGIIGIPFISILSERDEVVDEFEFNYNLGITININTKKDLIQQVDKQVNSVIYSDKFNENARANRMRLLNEKIDFNRFFYWYLMEYPISRDMMDSQPEVQNHFKSESIIVGNAVKQPMYRIKANRRNTTSKSIG